MLPPAKAHALLQEVKQESCFLVIGYCTQVLAVLLTLIEIDFVLFSFLALCVLYQVQEVFDDSPFYVPVDSVSIMNGTSEGMLTLAQTDQPSSALKYVLKMTD